MAGNSNVILIDPNTVNINNTLIGNVPFVNGIPQYQDMYIFVELIAESKGRTVIVTNNSGNNSEGTLDTQLKQNRTANFMGVNQDNTNNNPNYLNFTTNYYDGSTGDRLNYESFGISSIKIKINSSYVPQINIQFVDIRGLSFFNQNDSPYRMLFEFPAPTFILKVKGYYGKTLTYKLHLVRYTSEFMANNGNFIIDAEFIAQTFAPLTDVLFRYAINTPLINGESLNSDTKLAPKNTFELILKVKNLYSAVEDKVKSDSETREYESTKQNIDQINEIVDLLNNHVNDDNLKELGTPYLFYGNTGTILHEDTPTLLNNNYYGITKINNLIDYDGIISTLSASTLSTNSSNKLFIGYVIQSNVDVNNTETINPITYNQYSDTLVRFKTKLIPTPNSSLNIKLGVNSNDIILSQAFFGNINLQNGSIVNTKYIGLDLTKYYNKIYKKKTDLIAYKKNLANQIGSKINNIIEEQLGMKPTIYNIFKIILDDVDLFFNKLKNVAALAESVHNESKAKSIIQDNSGEKNEKIYAFPLIINRDNTICGGKREERIAPIELNKKISFPELNFVNDFIETFQKQARFQELYNMREEQNSDGTNVWIPISPLDSSIGGANSQSPYIGIDGFGDGVSQINESSDSKLIQIFKIILRRYYIISQGIVPYHFHELNLREGKKSDNYLKYYAQSEAVNLAESLINADYSNNVKLASDKYVRNIELFYSFLNGITYVNGSNDINLFSFNNNIVEFFPINEFNQLDGLIYTNKNNSNFKGLSLYFGNVETQSKTENSESKSNPVDKFRNEISGNWVNNILGISDAEAYFDFTKENLQYVIDRPSDGFNVESFVRTIGGFVSNLIGDGIAYSYDGIDWLSRFLYFDDGNFKKFLSAIDPIRESYSTILKKILNEVTQQELLDNGNILLKKYELEIADSEILSQGGHIVDIWSESLTNFDTKIFNNIINVNSKLSAFILLSNFGYTLSPFNQYPNRLNNLVFDIPAVISVPRYILPYIGAIIDAVDSGWINDIISFFNNTGNEFQTKGYFIFADLHDINKYMSSQDKELFKLEFNNFYFGEGNYISNYSYNSILTSLNALYQDVNDNVLNKDKDESYKYYLDPVNGGGGGTYYTTIIKPLIERVNILNYSQITFRMVDTFNSEYISIGELNNNVTSKQLNDNYFQFFFQKLSESITSKQKNIEEKENELKKLLGDNDIITQTYYSFKNINDKWLSSPTNANVGYPFTNGKSLIDSFVFVDRAMNPIGDTVINAEILADMFDDPNLTIYSALSQILSTNGFEFFPLQNFMNFKTGKWEDSFKIDTSGDISNQIAFVCMYIGGTSSYPTTSNNGFKNDGIVDIENPGVSDFSTLNCEGQNPNDDNQIETYPNFPWRTVRAFRVRFGEQNQSMFTNIKIDSKEYPETNESIQILSRLAGDNKLNAPTPKGQNLYNLYENRSYKATITSLGNAMIQPTQYFQLENIPMFNGAYVILDVEHNIDANKMFTTFSGVKILKYPIPRVTNPVVFVGLDDIGDDPDFNKVIAGNELPADLPANYQISKYLMLYDTIAVGSPISGNGAARRGLNNIPNNIEIENIKYLAKSIYDPLRDHFGLPIWIESFYRGENYNEAVNGSENSQHRFGQAIDLDDDLGGIENSEIFYYIINNLDFDQIIWEKGNGLNPNWVHVSLVRSANRKKITLYYANSIGKNIYEHFKTLNEFNVRKNEIYG